MNLPGRYPRACQSAFTLAEIATAMGLFSLVVIGVVYAQLFGLRMFNITSTRLSASDNARKVLNCLREDVRSGKILYVGNGNSAGFTRIALNFVVRGKGLPREAVARAVQLSHDKYCSATAMLGRTAEIVTAVEVLEDA